MFAQETASGAPSAVHNPHAPADGKIKIKIQVVQPSSDSAHDQPLWAIKVDEDITLGAFLERASAKIGFAPALLSGLDAAEHICTEESFARWVAGRVRDGRNYPILAYPATNVRASS
ncbi:hypothetical protein PLICRDRAFT_37337 [Plicaturopsis crispa FD-325 SS-3]|nr:hypothetical protein PLICRDRAFT_37337 [Plicaturopsis crispa FD-325 SS-3]